MPAIMVVGTTSHAGKSLLTAAICRLLKRRGYAVTPFKGQNMALNAYVTAEGGEIGHAQAVQAWAAGVEPRVAMNPILLKPQGNMTSQVILNGQAVGQTGAAEYYERFFDRGWQAITDSLAELQQDYEYIVCEGAGSPAEINLKHRDLTNMRVAQHLQAKTVLVADIDRGGVFAHIVGTLELLEPAERDLIVGFVINKFRGQLSLLQSGLDWLEERTGKPVLGVIPYFQSRLPAEDSLDLFDRRPQDKAEIEIGVVRLPRIANFTDFEPLVAEPSVRVTYWERPPTEPKFDALIIPGSKTTIADGEWLQAMGWAAAIPTWQAQGLTVLGICGGLQLLGRRVLDPEGLEGGSKEVQGLGLLPIETTIGAAKVLGRRQVEDRHFGLAEPVTGYEIHQGQTVWQAAEQPARPLFADASLGWVLENQIWATYLHGLLENTGWRRAWLNCLRDRRGLAPLPLAGPDYVRQRDAALDEVADLVGENLDLEKLISKF
jgi:adenosylcobyric acid synthase